MLDMRYHIASLVAVFIALAIGILLGTVIVDKGILVQQQQALVKRIETNFNSLREENKTLKTELDLEKRLTSGVYPLSVKGRLEGQNLAIIVTTKKQDVTLSEIADGLGTAGANVNIIRLKEDYELTGEVMQELAPYFEVDLGDEKSRELVLKKMANELVGVGVSSATTTTAKPTVAYLDKLRELGFITIDGDIVKPITGTLVFGGTDGDFDPNETDRHIISELKAIGVRVVGVENSDCKKSYIKEYQQAGIPTVDNIDSPAGVISAVFALKEADGNFGLKPTADQLVPKP
jgi:hypothetical protein